MINGPHILEIKQLWEKTSKLDDARERDYDRLDELLIKIFWNPITATNSVDYESFRIALTNFFNSLRELEDKYKEVSRLLVQYYPEVFINGPK